MQHLDSKISLLNDYRADCVILLARLADAIDVGRSYPPLYFRDIYWKLAPSLGIKFKRAVGLLPDLLFAILGLHMTCSRIHMKYLITMQADICTVG